ncbi:MAG: hypothetical protein Fur009_1250 [Candidatus Microgenomates bacterium]
MPSTILANSSKPKVALSIGATHPRLIAYQNIFSDSLPESVKRDFSFPSQIYGLINLLTLGEPNLNEIQLLKLIKHHAYLYEYKHDYTIELPFSNIYYQPQYGWEKNTGFFGSEEFNHFYDQTLNLIGQGIDAQNNDYGFVISAPWWFNQPNNPWAIKLSIHLLNQIGIIPTSILSCDTGGQTGFYYQKDGQYNFSHSGPYANMQHTTLALFGFI